METLTEYLYRTRKSPIVRIVYPTAAKYDESELDKLMTRVPRSFCNGCQEVVAFAEVGECSWCGSEDISRSDAWELRNG